MNSQKGITLITITIYILIVFIVLMMLATITSNFRDTIKNEDLKSEFLVELDKFNMYFLNDVKNSNNDIDIIDINGKFIKFTNGNKYIFSSDTIYLENIEENKKIAIAKNIEECKFSKKTEEIEKIEQIIIIVEIKINDTTKKIEYTLNKENEYNSYQDEKTYSYSEIPVEGISLNKETTTLNISEQEQLLATISPENATNTNIIWSSSNSNVAEVNTEGIITAISSGIANITVTTEYGNYTDICIVNVNEND